MRPTGLETRHLERLLGVGRGLVAMRDPEEVLQQVLEAAQELTGARFVAMGVLDANKRELDRFLVLGVEEETKRRIGPLPRGYGILGELIRHPAPLRLDSISSHPHSYGFPAGHPPMETFLGVPVMIRGEVFGNLYLSEKEDGENFDDADESLLVILAEWAAIAIDNARSHADEQERRGELERVMRGLEATVSLNRELGGETNLDRVLELVVKRARALADADGCIVLLADDRSLRIADVAGEVDRDLVGQEGLMDSAAGSVLRAGRSQRVGDGSAKAFPGSGIDASAGLLIPMRARGMNVGVLVALDPVAGGRFSADDELALESFATAAANAIGATRSIEDERVRLSIASSERERQRWARELHDETLQELSALSVMQEGAIQLDDPDKVRALLTQANEHVGRIISGLHGLITELRPASLDQLGIGPAIEALVNRVGTRSGLAIELDVDLAFESGRESSRHTRELEATIYRITQEALTNVVKHADASTARVLIEERDGVVAITVEDDGKGIDADSSHDGFGMLGMQERVALAGGELAVSASPDGGTRVRATLPAVRIDV